MRRKDRALKLVLLVWFIILLLAVSYLIALALSRETWGASISAPPQLQYTLPYDKENVDLALSYLTEGKRAHQFYVNNPQFCTDYSGNQSYHIMWIQRYEYIEQLIKELSNYKVKEVQDDH